MPDSILPPIMAEILAVLERHDVAGMIFLSMPPHGEVGYNLTASWSGASMINREFQNDASDVDKFKATATAISCLHQLAQIAVEDTGDMLITLGSQRPFRGRVETPPAGE